MLIHDEGVANLPSNLDDHKASGPDWKLANIVPVVKKGEKLFQANTDQCPTPAYPANY